ncbi:MAG TPA: hypothetical protein VF178_04545, partial [Gemmatimonadaceae bacterium]
PDGDGWRVQLAGGEAHAHRPFAREWRITQRVGDEARIVTLGGRRSSPPAAPSTPARTRTLPPTITVPQIPRPPAGPGDLTRWSAEQGPRAPWRARLGREHYRRSELSWSEAGAPEALVVLAASAEDVFIEITMRKPAPRFAPWRAENPLDNEHPDINSDGVQVYVRSDERPEGTTPYSWILVPEPDADRVRVTPRLREGPPVALHARWRRTEHGYQILVAIPRTVLSQGKSGFLDVAINEIDDVRERRRGQLVLSGARGEWVYLRGDRQDPDRYLPIRIADD